MPPSDQLLFLSIPNVDTKQRDGVFSPPSGKKDRKLREGIPGYSSRSSRRPRRPSRSGRQLPTEAGRSDVGGGLLGESGSTLKIRKRNTPSVIFRLWSRRSSRVGSPWKR